MGMLPPMDSAESASDFMRGLFSSIHERYVALHGGSLCRPPRGVEVIVLDEGRFGMRSEGDRILVDVSILSGSLSAIAAALSAECGGDPVAARRGISTAWADLRGIDVPSDELRKAVSMSASVAAYLLMHGLGHIYLDGEGHDKEVRADVLSAEAIASMISDPPGSLDGAIGPWTGMSPLLFWDIMEAVWGKNPFEDSMARKALLKRELAGLISTLPAESAEYYSRLERGFGRLNAAVDERTGQRPPPGRL